MEERVPANEIRLLLKGETALGLDVLQAIQVREAAIGQRLVGQGPQMLRWLQLRRVGRQDEEVDPLGYGYGCSRMPPGSIEHQEDALGRPCPEIASDGSQHPAEEGCIDGGQQPPLGLPGGGTDKPQT